MVDTKDLQNAAAIKEIQKLVNEQKTCMFCTSLTAMPFSTRPMSAQKVDDDGVLWFLSDKRSDKNAEIKENNEVQLLFANTGNYTFLNIYGTAEELFDKQKIDELWEPLVKAWFTEGKDDPNVSVIKVTPKEGYYWDTKYGKMVGFMYMLASVVTGAKDDAGIEGNIQL